MSVNKGLSKWHLTKWQVDKASLRLKMSFSAIQELQSQLSHARRDRDTAQSRTSDRERELQVSTRIRLFLKAQLLLLSHP
jgi:hypothetical protein